MGGYNTVCEILSLKKPSLIIPRENPRLEQRIRAEILKERGLADFLPWNELSPQALHHKIHQLLEDSQDLRNSVQCFPMTGLEVMRSRLGAFRREDR